MDFLPSSRERTGRLGRRTRRRERKQPPRPGLKLRRQRLQTDLPGPVTRSRRQFHPVFLWWEDLLGRSSSDCPSGTKGSERHRSHSGERGRRDRSHGAERRHDSPRYRHSPRRWESGEQARPTSSSGGSSSRSKQADLTDLLGSGRASGRAMDVRPSSTHHRHHHGRRESVDKDKSGSSHVSRRDVELSPVVPQPPERRTYPVATQASREGRLCRCEGPDGLGRGCRLGRCDGPGGLGRKPGLSRWRVSRRSRLDRGWRAWSCGQLGRCCRPGTWRGLGRCGWLGRSPGLDSWRLSKGWRACCTGHSSREYSS